ncbi:MAG: hypothetical protein AAB276_00450, partial [Pseudomonadota bacterium]
WLPTLQTNHVVYAGSVFGSGGLAVALAARQLGIKATILMARSKYTPPWISDIEGSIQWTYPLPVAQLHTMGEDIANAVNLPLGFDHPNFRKEMVHIIRNTILRPPPEIWCSALSGTLARAIHASFPDIPLHVVTPARMAVPIANAHMHLSPEKYHQPARILPPYPSCPFSDAKIWQFAEKMAVSGAYIWNVSH